MSFIRRHHALIKRLSIPVILGLPLFFLITEAAPPTSKYAPGEELNPTCAPGDVNCTVSLGWELNTTDGYVYNDTDFIGIGTDFSTITNPLPSAQLTNIRSYEASDNDAADGGAFEILYKPVGFKSITDISSTLAGDTDIQGSVYSGGTIAAAWTVNADLTGGSQLYGFSSQGINFSSGTVDFVGGGISGAYAFSGITNELQGFVSTAGINGGAVDSANGYTGAVIIDTGTFNSVSGLSGNIDNQSSNDFGPSGSTADGLRVKYRGTSATGGIAQYIGIDIATLLDDPSHSIDNASGILISYKPTSGTNGIISSGTSVGLEISGDGTVEGVIGSDTYGLFMGPVSLNGTNSEYGLYIADAEAENYFVNGLRLGVDSADYKLQGVNNGGIAELHFGPDPIISGGIVSDERLKNSITNSSVSIDDIMNIRIVDFTYDQSIINDGGDVHVGVIAQELEQVFPDAIRTRGDGYKIVNYPSLIPALIKAVQDLQQQLSTGAIHIIDEVQEIFVRKVTVEELCVGDTCITESDLIELLGEDNSPSRSASPAVIDNTPAVDVSENPEVVKTPEEIVEEVVIEEALQPEVVESSTAPESSQ